MIPPAPPAVISQNPADRAACLAERIARDSSRSLLSAAEQKLYTAELAAAKSAALKHDPGAAAMFDGIERQLAPVDFILSRANDRQAIVVHPGDDVTVAMNDRSFWDVSVSDSGALVRPVGMMFVRGTQGVWKARKPATVTVTATQRGGSAVVWFAVVILPSPAANAQR